MPKSFLQDVVFTAIMATVMVYGMIVYNIALAMGGLTAQAFLFAFKELYIMAPIAFVLELFVVGFLARKLAFTFMKPTDRPFFITIAISVCICCMMCPIMSAIATCLFKSPTWATFMPLFISTWAKNLPMALLYQLCYCGPLVRLIFKGLMKLYDLIKKAVKKAPAQE